ncbi:MAG: flagellar biosynthesis protein FlhB [Acetobacteraceae bacterium]|nr:flagellar biosynthesis protein FlhB [Acetobacteraceae bacterium]
MAEDAANQEDRTEAATPRRLQRAREQGQVAVSRELATLAGLAAALLACLTFGQTAAQDLPLRLSVFLAHADAVRLVGPLAFTLTWQAIAFAAAPIILAVLVGGAGAILLQTGFLFNPTNIRVDLARIDPRAGLGRLLSGESVVEAAKSLAKLAIVSLVVWHVVAGILPATIRLAFQKPQLLLGSILPPVFRIFTAVLILQTAIAGFDLFWVRFRQARQLRMSRQDIREEMKETEGDPKIKARIRQIRMQRARKRMLAAVPKATVIITNPTHYAVALAYDRARNAAPRVVAKGADLVAARIRDVAKEHGVPLVANPPLARALYRVEVDTDIPQAHYQAVAEIIAYVWGLRRGRRR